MKEIVYEPIGVIHTPYVEKAPHQPVEEKAGEFKIELYPKYVEGLYRLEDFKYIYVIYHLDKIGRKPSMLVKPPWAGGVEVGLFASRSPVRINGIGLSVVRLEKIEENIEYLLDNPKLAKQMGKAGRRHVEKNFEITKVSQKLYRVYESLVE